ncbi:Arm DNA-binding domain-containing protein [Anthocerotibacter panamensis]|uniref:Arm DNA-binding domain-containing protein n=1 Tax=Anthocerotibacter panamensis TaxID=2857077 RepID=UPI0036F44995
MRANIQRKAPKETVSVEEFRGRLRLRWRYGGRQYSLGIELPDFRINRQAAERKGNEIYLDIVSGHFDPTLKQFSSSYFRQFVLILRRIWWLNLAGHRLCHATEDLE